MERGIAVIFGLCKKDMFDIPTKLEWRKVKLMEKVRVVNRGVER